MCVDTKDKSSSFVVDPAGKNSTNKCTYGGAFSITFKGFYNFLLVKY
jgi:hypothetical protein